MPKRVTRAERQAETRAALIEAAGRVIAQRGFHGASIEAITAEAGYTGGAFYANFSSKEDLFIELLEQRVFGEWRKIAAASVADPMRRPTAREVGEISAAMNRHPDSPWIIQLWLELMANARRNERLRRVAAELWRGSRAMSTAILTAAYEAAGIQPPVPVEHLVSAMMALETGPLPPALRRPRGRTAELLPELFALLLGPLEPPPA